MTTISAKIIADSVSPEGIRIATMHLRYPRMIHSELMTHRVFGRNARSSRAVPINKMIEEIETNPVIPIHWGAAQKGMQAYEETDSPVKVTFPYVGQGGNIDWHGRGDEQYVAWGQKDVAPEQAWLQARDYAVEIAKAFAAAGYHKQVVNRLLEPFMHIDTLVTATQWSNFFALRNHHAAEPHIQKLAQVMAAEMGSLVPKPLKVGEWHLPYVEDEELQEYGLEVALKLSVARCARISYTPFDGNADIESELRRYDLLVGSQPIHASPAEHQATPDEWDSVFGWKQPSLHGNLTGWLQYRKMLPGECQ